MPNIKSAIKRVNITRAKTLKNSMRKSALKSTIKRAKEALAKKDETAYDTVKKAIKALDKAVAKKLIHKNTAARKKSKLAKALNAINQ